MVKWLLIASFFLILSCKTTDPQESRIKEITASDIQRLNDFSRCMASPQETDDSCRQHCPECFDHLTKDGENLNIFAQAREDFKRRQNFDLDHNTSLSAFIDIRLNALKAKECFPVAENTKAYQEQILAIAKQIFIANYWVKEFLVANFPHFPKRIPLLPKVLELCSVVSRNSNRQLLSYDQSSDSLVIHMDGSLRERILNKTYTKEIGLSQIQKEWSNGNHFLSGGWPKWLKASLGQQSFVEKHWKDLLNPSSTLRREIRFGFTRIAASLKTRVQSANQIGIETILSDHQLDSWVGQAQSADLTSLKQKWVEVLDEGFDVDQLLFDLQSTSTCQANNQENKVSTGIIIVENNHSINVCFGGMPLDSTCQRDVKNFGLLLTVSTSDCVNVSAFGQISRVLERILVERSFQKAITTL